MAWTPLILDGFIFDEANLEVPERLSDLGGTQSVSTHEYPGGIIEQKSYGYFPGEQKWSGRFHGMDASDRMNAVKRILYTGNEVQLSFGPNAWLGRVVRFTPVARSQWLFDYELEFKPRLDTSSGAPSLPTTGALGTILALHILALQSLIKNGLDPTFVTEAAALAIGGPIGAVLLQVQETVLSTGGTIAGISPSGREAIFASTLGALAQIEPYKNSTNPAISSPATDASARVSGIRNVFLNASAPQTTIQTINPNLYVLSAQYYGDASDWRVIANANSLNDPQPIGSYTLTIPPAPA